MVKQSDPGNSINGFKPSQYIFDSYYLYDTYVLYTVRKILV